MDSTPYFSDTIINLVRMQYLCDVIILTWNQLETTKVCIESYLVNTLVPTRLIIIDNASNESTRQYLFSLRSTPNCKIEIILNEKNLGFVKGMNQGIAMSSAPYVCLANNDLIFTSNWLGEIINIFKKYREAGVLNPDSNTLGVSPYQRSLLQSFACNLKSEYKDVFVEMPYCVGFCMVIRREVIEKVGGLSEEFCPMFFEDSDFSMKAQKAGFRIGIAKASYVFHNEHSSTGKIGNKKEEIFIESKKTFVKKWGRMLRVALVIKDEKSLDNILGEAVGLARNGNFIRVFVKNLKEDSKGIFRKNNFNEHSGIKFIKYKSILGLMWKILKKRKRYDVIVNNSRNLNALFTKLEYKTLEILDKEEIYKIKMS